MARRRLNLEEPLDELGLSARALHPLKRVGLETVRDVLDRRASELRAIPNYGPTRVREVEQALIERGLSLRPER